jgi:uncharacterized protein (DUF1501 family)
MPSGPIFQERLSETPVGRRRRSSQPGAQAAPKEIALSGFDTPPFPRTQSGRTVHGSANAHFAPAGELKGHYGEPLALNRLDGNGNLAHAPDFRQLDATVLEDGWGADSASVLRSRYGRLA